MPYPQLDHQAFNYSVNCKQAERVPSWELKAGASGGPTSMRSRQTNRRACQRRQGPDGRRWRGGWAHQRTPSARAPSSIASCQTAPLAGPRSSSSGEETCWGPRSIWMRLCYRWRGGGTSECPQSTAWHIGPHKHLLTCHTPCLGGPEAGVFFPQNAQLSPGFIQPQIIHVVHSHGPCAFAAHLPDVPPPLSLSPLCRRSCCVWMRRRLRETAAGACFLYDRCASAAWQLLLPPLLAAGQAGATCSPALCLFALKPDVTHTRRFITCEGPDPTRKPLDSWTLGSSQLLSSYFFAPQ